MRAPGTAALIACVLMLSCSASMARTVANAGAPPAKAAAIEAPHDYRDKNFDYFVSGDPRLPRAAHTRSLIALFGGGGRVDAAFQAIAKDAGGGHIVILGAVADDSFDPDDGHYGQSFKADWGPVASAQTIVFHNRDAASDPRVLAAIRGADGIFLRGGDQSQYLRYWKGTPVQAALNDHVRAHRPIGGSSAGLAVLGHYSYTAMDGGSMESKTALADPFNAGMTLESDFLHCPGLDHVITDTHFSARSRLGRLIAFIARINDADGSANAFGIGVDEKTTLLVDGRGIGRLAAGSAGSAWIVELPKATKKLPRGRPLSLDNIRITQIDAKSSIDLASRRATRAAAETRVSLHEGKSDTNPLVGSMMMRDVVPPGEE